MEKNMTNTGKWVVASIGMDQYKTSVQTNSHKFIADEPEAIGGGNQAPGPSDFLMTALATCTAITLRMYADRKELPVTQITVKVMLKIDYALGNLSSNFDRQIEIEGNISKEQYDQLLHVANSCPIHNILTHPIQVSTQIDGAQS